MLDTVNAELNQLLDPGGAVVVGGNRDAQGLGGIENTGQLLVVELHIGGLIGLAHHAARDHDLDKVCTQLTLSAHCVDKEVLSAADSWVLLISQPVG